MWKRSLSFVAILIMALTTSSCIGLDKSEVRLGEEFSLSIGQNAFITGENLTVKLEEVIEDSRCPRGVTCVWAGRVSCVIKLTHAGSSYRMALTELGLTKGYSTERYERYEFAFHVTPYPEAGEKIHKNEYRLHLIISKLPELTRVIGPIIVEPLAFEGMDVTIVGYYRGWDLLHETNASSPVTRSDWVIKDSTGAIYISANSEARLPEELRPDSLQDVVIVLEVKGVVFVTKEGQPYIEAKSIEHVS